MNEMEEPEKKPLAKTDIQSQKLLAHAIDFYHKTLLRTPKALAFLQRKGLDNIQTIEKYTIGYSDRAFGRSIPDGQLKAGKEMRQGLQAVGILKGSGHETFYGSLVIPLLDRQGRIVDAYGTKIGRGLRRGAKRYTSLIEENNPAILEEKFKTKLEQIVKSQGTNEPTQEDALPVLKTPECGLAPLGETKLDVDMGETLNQQETPYSVSEKEPFTKLENERNNESSIKEPIPKCEDVKNEEKEDVQKKPDTKSLAQNDEVTIQYGERKWRIRGVGRNLSYNTLKLNLLVSNEASLYVDSFDLYLARHRKAFIAEAARELNVQEKMIKRDVGRIILELEEVQDRLIKAALESQNPIVEISPDEKREAKNLLNDPNLLERIVEDFHNCGIVGENDNLLIGYLAAVSRKLDKPLAVVIQSSSAAGKTSLMDAVLAFVPTEEKLSFSAMTGQSLYYLGEEGIKNKVLAIAEGDGIDKATYALKLLQSEGELAIASTNKDSNGRLVAETYKAKGPTAIMLTTTAHNLDEELLNRAIVLTVNEDREQTRAIQRFQRQSQSIEGVFNNRNKKAIERVQQNAQRLLRSIVVVNPYADKLTFTSNRTRTRRDQTKYLGLINSIALLRQFQRPIKTICHQGETIEYIEVQIEDIEVANRLAAFALGKSLSELAPQTKRLLSMLNEMVEREKENQEIEQEEVRFTRRQAREFTGLSYDQVTTHLKRLVQFEYLLVHRGGRGQSFVYELMYNGQLENDEQGLLGLIDTKTLQSVNTTSNSEDNKQSLGPHLGPIRANSEPQEKEQKLQEFNTINNNFSNNPKSAPVEKEKIRLDTQSRSSTSQAISEIE